MYLFLFDYQDISSKELVVKLWYHECMRVFQDRLVDFDDRFKFNMIINSILTLRDFATLLI